MWLLSTAALTLLALSAPALAAAPVLDEPISLQQLIKGDQPAGLVVNSSFLPSAKARKAKQPFVGTLHLCEARMATDPDPLTSGIVFGKDPAYFPRFSIGFFTDRGRLVPKTQEIIRVGSRPGGTSYWDVIVGPGRVWAEPADRGWSRASFPFVLMHVIEGESHNGVATFAYKGKRVTNVQFQVVQQTSPYYVVDFFTSWGMTQARCTRGLGNLGTMAQQRVTWRRSVARSFPSASWTALEAKVGPEVLEGFDGDIAPADHVVSALVYKGVLYRQVSSTPAGPYPYPDDMRFGVWSQTKSFALSLGLLRLAQKYGPEVLDARLVDYVPEAAAQPGWSDVTFGDLANMASGHGFGSNIGDPPDIDSGSLGGDYATWYEAPSAAGKLALGLDDPVHPWAPGTVVRYRDQDAFLYGVALDRYLKRHAGPKADIWDMLRREVYRPIGIYYAPMARTIEADGSRGQAMMMYGYYPTLADEARVAQLLHQRGAWNGRQLLYAKWVDTILPSATPHGLPTGKRPGQYYWRNFWINPYQPAGATAPLYFGTMRGWGGNMTVLMPKGMTGIRLGKVWDSALDYNNPSGMLTVADRLGAFAQ